MLIMASGVMIGSRFEAGHVFAWRKHPTKKAVEGSGANRDLQNIVLIQFQTGASFQRDIGIDNKYVESFEPVISSRPGPISVENVIIVPLRR